MTTKICTKCNEDKPLDMFPLERSHTSYRNQGLSVRTHRTECRPCSAERAREWRKTHPNYRGTGKVNGIPLEDRILVSAIRIRISQAKQRAIKYDQETPDIDLQFMYELYKAQDSKCALSGVKMRVEKGAITCPSIDKIKADRGYIKGNVQWVAWAVNRAKGDMDEDVFFDMCNQILEYQKVQRLSKGSVS